MSKKSRTSENGRTKKSESIYIITETEMRDALCCLNSVICYLQGDHVGAGPYADSPKKAARWLNELEIELWRIKRQQHPKVIKLRLRTA